MLLGIVDNPFLFLGIFIVSGYSLSLILNKFGIPHVVTYLLTGFIVANLFFNNIDFRNDLHSWYILIENFALGLIGFKIGTEVKAKEVFKEPLTISILLLAEVSGAFIIVFLITFLFSRNFMMSLIFAGLAIPTAPAATVEMIRKLKAKGPFTMRIQWILAFDDVIAVIVVESILVFVKESVGHDLSFINYLTGILHEIGFAILIGFVIGFVLDYIVERMEDDLEMMEFTLAVLIISIGLGFFLQTSVILTTMVIGATVTNLGGDNYEKAQDLLEIIMSPVVAIFFVFVGASVKFSYFSPFPLLAIFYLLARTSGKIGGAFLGSARLPFTTKMRWNLGFGLLAQGGVVLGLVSIVGDILEGGNLISMGNTIITVVVIATILSDILGSYGAKFAIINSGENNKLGKDVVNKIKETEKEEKSRETHPLI